MVKRLATSPHDPLGITDSACKNHLVMIAYDIHEQRRAVNPRQRSIESNMHRDLTQSSHLMTPTESWRFEKTEYAAGIHLHLKELYGENSRIRRKPLPMPILRNWQSWTNGGMTSLRHGAM
ncbi:hypothetical protein F511_28907 [Dorcoceras hygrometricum]|uniref:Uncharacterized protein n=1 Tax=Dorcoceras hygrometricum TaxID=472368 RepID=A0A2Z7CU38_9LAMI|nr:hypothetical protein F511_28907 [Dorcoceras hygrometricum]